MAGRGVVPAGEKALNSWPALPTLFFYQLLTLEYFLYFDNKAKCETDIKSWKVRVTSSVTSFSSSFLNTILVVKHRSWIMQTYNSCKLIPNEMETSQVLICWTWGREYNELERTDAKMCPPFIHNEPQHFLSALSLKWLWMSSIWLAVFLLRKWRYLTGTLSYLCGHFTVF